MNAQTESYTRLHGRWLFSARLAWITSFIVLTLMYVFGFLAVHETLSTVCDDELCTLRQQIRHTAAGDKIVGWPGPPIGYADRLHPEQIEALKTFGLTLNQYAWLGALQMGIPVVIYLVIAAGLFWWKSDDWMVLFASVMIATFPLQDMPLPFTLAVHQPAWEWVLDTAGSVALGTFLSFALIFPNGRFVPHWTRWMAVFEFTGAVIVTLFQNSISGSDAAEKFVLLYLLISFGTGIFAQLYRYFQVASPAERQQIKWVIVGLAGFVTIALVVLIPLDALLTSQAPGMDPSRALILSTIPDTLFRVISLFIPISIAISVLRYRLWDIDVIISRTLVYGALTASVVGLYILIVGGLGTLVQTQNNLPGILIAVMTIAFLFQPLRRRLQDMVNHFVPVPKVIIRESPPLPVPQIRQEQEGTAVDRAPNTILRGRWLIIMQLVWAAVFITLTTMYAFSFRVVRDILSTVCEEEQCTLKQQIRHTVEGDKIISWPGSNTGYADRLRPNQVEALETLGLTLNQYGLLATLQMGIPVLVYLLTATGLFSRKSNDWMALFVSTMVMMFPLVVMPLYVPLVVRQPIWQWVSKPAYLVSFWFFLIFPLVFPNGQFVPRWTRWKVLFDFAYLIVSNFILPEPPAAEHFRFAYSLISFCVSAYALAYRYFRVASPLERQQIKWVVAGLVGFMIIGVPLDALATSQAANAVLVRGLILSAILDTLFQAISLFIPMSIVISVLRYRLWDIDVIISRTLVYGALTTSIITLYILLVGALSLLSQTTGNLLISLLATGLIAFLFQPLRERLQGSVNRLLYGDRDDPYAALSRLGRRLESSITPEAVLPTIVTTVREALKLPYTAIYLKQPDDDYKIIAESASPTLHVENGKIRVPGMNREGQCIPLIHQGETLGYLVLGPRTQNEAFTSSDLRLVDDLAPQVGVAVHAMRLTSDLQRSREQLVLTREEERRRLRRDLHDGLGPSLASQGLKLAAVKQLLENNPTAAIPLLDQVMTQNKSTVDDVRHLVYGLRPPALDELGLVAAIRDHVAGMDGKSALQIEITEPSEGLPPLSAAVEVAAYRIALEALTNVIRHAQAKHCAIRFSVSHNGSSDALEIEIRDDGKGMREAHRAGVGLRSMRERAEELGGACVIESNARQGTCVSVKVPLIVM